jgi:hypothetical protein
VLWVEELGLLSLNSTSARLARCRFRGNQIQMVITWFPSMQCTVVSRQSLRTLWRLPMAALSAAAAVFFFASARHRAVCNITPLFSLSLTDYSYVVYLTTLLVICRVYGVMNWKGFV